MEGNKRIVKFYGRPGEDYQLWAARIEACLHAKKAISAVLSDSIGEELEPHTATVKEQIADARAIIVQGLRDKPLRLCLPDLDNPFKMWNRLRDRYAVTNLATKVQLQTKLARLSYRNQAMPDYVAEFEDIFNRLAGMSSEVDEDMRVASFLASFGDRSASSYGHIITSLPSTTVSVKWESVTARLLQEYEDKLWVSDNPKFAKQNPEPAAALNVHRRSRHKGRAWKANNHSKQQVRCYACNELGHIARHCTNRQLGYNGGPPQAHHATMLMAQSSPSVNGKLLLDSGASDHMVTRLDYLYDVTEIQPKAIILGNGDRITACIKGKLAMKARIWADGAKPTFREITLHGVLYVPELHANLISVSSLSETGPTYSFNFGKRKFNCTRNGTVQFEGRLQNGVYVINATVMVPSNGNAMAAMRAAERLWHDRLGHEHLDSIRELARKNVVTGLDLEKPTSSGGSCESCIAGKQRKMSMSHNPHRASTKGEVIHSDVCGPMTVPSLGGSTYFTTFIDELSGYVTVVPISKKSDVSEKFRHYRVWLERRYDCTIKRLHCDGGGEYTALDEYLRSNGIERGTVPPYNKEQNGIAERANRTLIESARSLLHHANLPKAFGAEAVVFAADIRNRFLCPRQKDRTSFEMMANEKPRVDHIRVFGSHAWTHIPKEKRRKLDMKSEEGVLVACYDNSHYKVWLPGRQTAVIARHVRILENTFPDQECFDTSSHEDEIIADSYSKSEGNGADFEENVDVLTHTSAVPSTYGEEDKTSPAAPVNSVAPAEEEIIEENQRNSDSASRYSARHRNSPSFYEPGSVHFASAKSEPSTVEEAFSTSEANFWKEAVSSEIESLKKHNTWEKVALPPGAKLIPTRFVFRRKMKDDGSVGHWKVRLVVKGFMQGFVDQTYAPVVDFSTIRAAFSVAVAKGYYVHQMDVKTAFLHGDVDEEVFVSPPEGAGIIVKPGEGLRLKKGLYGLKQAPRIWYEKWRSVMQSLGFHCLKVDNCVFCCEGVWILLYVDDVILVSAEIQELITLERELKEHLEMVDLGELKSFLGVQFMRDEEGAWIYQTQYTTRVLCKYGMSNCIRVSTPTCLDSRIDPVTSRVDRAFFQEIIGSLLFLATRTRPDICVAVNLLCRHFADPQHEHLVAARRIIRYLSGTRDYGIRLQCNQNELEVFSDSAWAGDQQDRKSTSGTIVFLASSAITWKSSKQNCTALSSTEAEFIAMSEASKTAVWIRALLKELGQDVSRPTKMMVDNQGAIEWGTTGVRKSKHVSVRYNFVKEQVDCGAIEIVYCPSQSNRADILTKPMLRVAFERNRDSLGVFKVGSGDEDKRGT